MNRRGFLSSILALGAAPAVVRAASLMPWKATESGLLVQDAMAALLELVRDPRIVLSGWYADRDYYEGLQWTPEEMEILAVRRQPIHVINLLKPEDCS